MSEQRTVRLLRKCLDRVAPQGSGARAAVSLFRASPLKFPLTFVSSVYATRQLSGRWFSFACVVYPGAKLKIIRHRSARVELKGRLLVRPWLGGSATTRLLLGRSSTLRIDGDFVVGQGVAINVSRNASLIIGGRRASSGSGITSDTIVMAQQSIRIGADTIIAWGCFVTDSD
jgi:hypothetical protein